MGYGLLFLSPVFCVMGNIKGLVGAEAGRKYIPHPVLTCFLLNLHSTFPCAEGKVAGFSVARFLIPLCIPELLVILVYTMKGSNARGLCTYCQVNQGALQLKYYFGQEGEQKARKVKKRQILQHKENVGILLEASVFHRCIICISPSTFSHACAPYHAAIFYF